MADSSLNAIAVELRSITKTFGSLQANSNISLTVRQGEILALVGENGAGKSTLMNILYGMHQADSGEILIQGNSVKVSSPSVAIKHGIGMVHQHFMLIPPFTVTENIILGNEPVKWGGWLDKSQSTSKVQTLADQYNFKLDAKSKLESLSVGDEQRVEILKALFRQVKVLILDEPTAVLTPQETQEMFTMLKQFKAEGKTIIFISHKLKEVFALSDRIAVMRSGELIGEKITSETNTEEIAQMMVGREVQFHIQKKPIQRKSVVLDVENLTIRENLQKESVKNISFQVHGGEILGVAGVEGNGQSELIKAITGLVNIYSGDVRIKDISVKGKNPGQVSQLGLAHIPEDRLKRGLVRDFSLEENLILGRHTKSFFKGYWGSDKVLISSEATVLLDKFDIRPADPKALAANLSGGNQQKVIVARELAKNPCCLIAAQPTRGVDIGAIEFIHHQILNARDAGMAILLVSADLNEIMELSDRIAVLYNGEIMGILDSENATETNLGLLMAGIRKGVA